MPNRHSSKLVLVGAIPPPYGGVTIHLRRLLPALRERGLAATLFDISGRRKNAEDVSCLRWRTVVWHMLLRRRTIIHFHNFSLGNLWLYALLGTRHQTALTFHNERFLDEINAGGDLRRQLRVWLLNRLDYVIVVNDKCAALARTIVHNHTKLRVIPTFINPSSSINDSAPRPISDLREQHRILIASNAFRLSFHKGQDLYGIDMLIELTERLINRHHLDVITVVLLPDPGNESYLRQLQERVRELGIGERFLLATDPVDNAIPVWKIADVVVRATNTDGDSLSVLEALAVGTPVVGSDCVPRHPLVTLFKTRDLDDLERATVEVLSNLQERRQILKGLTIGDGVDQLVGLYQELRPTI